MPSAHDPDLHARGGEAPEPRPPSHRSGVVRLPQPSDTCLEAAVCEAVLRYQLQQPLMDQPQPLRYYLALQGVIPGTRSSTDYERLRPASNRSPTAEGRRAMASPIVRPGPAG